MYRLAFRATLVETELDRIIQRQGTELADLKRDHATELAQLAVAHTTTVERLHKERDEAVSKLETATDTHRRTLLIAQGLANDAMVAVMEMDEKISDKSFKISPD